LSLFDYIETVNTPSKEEKQLAETSIQKKEETEIDQELKGLLSVPKPPKDK